MQSANPIPSTEPAADVRLTPTYYFRPEGLGPYVTGLLNRCPSVFDIKAAMAADLGHRGEDLREGQGVVEDGALLQGDVIVQAGARIEAGAQVTGPVLVCAGAVVAAGALVRDHSVIGPGCRIGFGAEITRSLLAGHVFMKHPCFIGDSVIGRRVNIGSFCSTTGLRCDRGPVAEPALEEITVNLDGQRIPTGQTKFGAVIGDEVALPAGTVLSPGTLIGPGTVVYPRDHIGGFLPAGSRVR
ncbi:hypothetical protein PZ61_0236635 [Streptomyces sp. MNU77]|uniref:hypothetical protein n=1 Tax=Streptomyces sp. MNU77 TaxID=1573406 RepID=UPI00069867F0|nr:hypothetical protein [Streptomyces sp. MNU77]OLO25927.1 hypothetical protein PZ61_0236635 [Streptomyces sp. MNU77]